MEEPVSYELAPNQSGVKLAGYAKDNARSGFGGVWASLPTVGFLGIRLIHSTLSLFTRLVDIE
jgi:hypothetical protein